MRGCAVQTKQLKKRAAAPAPFTARDAQRQLRWAVDAQNFQHRDPLWHVSESFQQSFDRIGRRRAAQLALESGSGFSVEAGREAREAERPKAPGEAEPLQRPGRKKGYHPELPRTPIQTFSEMAFQRGTLASAVLQGTGRMMLATCLKRAAGQQEPPQHLQTLFGGGSQARNVPGSSPDQMLFHRGFAESAVGLVVDVLSDARSVVDTLAEMAGGSGALKAGEGAGTLRRVYPFLDDSRERQLLADYQARLATAGEGERPALQNALVHTRALIARKAQMKNEFINKLRWISDRAQEALEELESAETLEYLTAALGRPAGELPPPEPPPGPPEGEEGSDGAQPPEQPAAGPEPPTGPGPQPEAEPPA